MHFLEAHRISFALSAALAKGNDRRSICLRPKSLYPYDKDTLVKASKLTIAHSILYGGWEAKDYDLFFNCLNSYNEFVDDELYYHMIDLTKIVEMRIPIIKALSQKKIANAMNERIGIVKLWSDSAYVKSTNKGNTHDDVVDYFNIMKKKKADLYIGFNDGERKDDSEMYEAIKHYIVEAYSLANIDFKSQYYRYFYSFDSLRKLLNNIEYSPYYKDYETDILHSRI